MKRNNLRKKREERKNLNTDHRLWRLVFSTSVHIRLLEKRKKISLNNNNNVYLKF